jgi:hypothetical protein
MNPQHELTEEQRICFERDYHDEIEFIDSRTGAFTRLCKTCGRYIDREGSDE